MKDSKLLTTGVGGALVAALCCGTPILVIVLGALGLSAWLVYADDVVFPALIIILTIGGYAFWRQQRRRHH